MAHRAPLHREQAAVLATLVLLTVAAWTLTLGHMRDMAPTGGFPPSGDYGAMAGQPGMGGMAMGEAAGSEPGVRLVLYLGLWTAMMAAMMLPAAAPMILIFGTVYRAKRERGDAFVPTWILPWPTLAW